MSHVYNKNPEMGGPAEPYKSKAERLEVPASSGRKGKKLESPDPKSFESFAALDRDLPATPEKKSANKMDAADLANAELLLLQAEYYQDPLRAEIIDVREKSNKASESWYERMARGTRDVTAAAGSLWASISRSSVDKEFQADSPLNEVARAGKEIFIDAPLDALFGKNGPSVLKMLREDKSIHDLGRNIGDAGKEFLGAMTREENDSEIEMKSLNEDFRPDNLAGARDLLRNLAETVGLSKEKSAIGEVFDRRAELAQITKYVIGGGFLKEVYSGVKDRITGKERKAIEAAFDGLNTESLHNEPKPPSLAMDVLGGLKDGALDATYVSSLTELGRDYIKAGKYISEIPAIQEVTDGVEELARFVGDGVIDLGRGYGKMFSYAAEQLRNSGPSNIDREDKQWESMVEEAENELEWEALQAGAERLDVAAVESDEIAVDAVKAKKTLAESVQQARDNFYDMINEAEASRTRRLSLLANKALKGSLREAVMQSVATLEHKINRYEAAMDKLDIKLAEANKQEAKATYQALFNEADAKLTARAKLLENPAAIKGKAREMILAEMRELNQQVDKYEAIMRAMNQLDNLTPEVRKDSVAA